MLSIAPILAANVPIGPLGPIAPAAAPPQGLATAAPPPAQMPASLQNFTFTQYVKSPLAEHYPWLAHAFAGFFLASAIALIVLLASQTTKQEGLSGTLGGRVESAYRPRLGFDQQLQRLTTGVAISFVVFALLVSLSGF
ncbi:MAG TPA: preprotein translocase subunit SecG [Candidatus Acidoferrales bacterium]|nr:preprotein translocase subunit SecG [Candidatus Acidoferrales bacterium]